MLAAFLSQHSASKRKLAAVIFTGMIGWSAGSGPAGAETKLKPELAKWKISEPFEKNEEARMNLSGAACVPTTPKFKSCLIANDQKKYAQFFSINGTTLKPRKRKLSATGLAAIRAGERRRMRGPASLYYGFNPD